MTRVSINGESVTTAATTLAELVIEHVGQCRGHAVALDDAVVPRADLATTPLRADARVEIVTAVQGG